MDHCNHGNTVMDNLSVCVYVCMCACVNPSQTEIKTQAFILEVFVEHLLLIGRSFKTLICEEKNIVTVNHCRPEVSVFK